MSRRVSFTPPPGARAYPLRTARGEFAVVDSPVAGGEAKGTVLMLPGFTGSKEDFTLLHEPLTARGYRVVAVDGRGQFESDGPEDDESAYARTAGAGGWPGEGRRPCAARHRSTGRPPGGSTVVDAASVNRHVQQAASIGQRLWIRPADTSAS
ncbi:hypothetical protein SALBM311S_11843 [Streptomyces alboniger]